MNDAKVIHISLINAIWKKRLLASIRGRFIQKFKNQTIHPKILGRFISKFKNQTIHFVSFLYKKKESTAFKKVADSFKKIMIPKVKNCSV